MPNDPTGAGRAAGEPIEVPEARLSELLDALPDPVFLLAPRRDASGDVVELEYRYLNAAALRLYGRPREAVLGHGLLELFPSLRGAERWAKYLAVIKSGETAFIEVPDFDQGGVRGSFRLHGARLGGDLLVTAREVTDLRHTADQLRRERDFVNAIVDAAGAPILAIDANGHIVRFNRQCELLSGYSEDEVLGRYYEFLVVPEERPTVAAVLEQVSGEQPVSQVNQFLTKNGDVRLVRWSHAAMVDDEGHPTLLIGVGVDITDQQRAEEELRHERDVVNALLDVAGALILVVDTEGRLVRFNRQLELVTGYREAEVLGQHYEVLLPADERGQVAAENLDVVGAGTPFSRVNHLITKDGELRLIGWSGVGLVNHAGQPEYAIGVGIDITEQQRAEDELARRAAELETVNRELARSNQDLEQFAYIASHDLNEPLRAIAGLLSRVVALYKGRVDKRADEFIALAVDAANRMQNRIDGLLAFSRAGQGERAITPADAARLADEALSNIRPLLDRARAVVTVEELPVVLADPHQLGQVFENLISNAVKFVAPGVEPRVTVAAEPAGDNWRFTVTDNGIGIPADQRERAFMMFRQLRPPGDYPGTGIGLALVKKIIERSGGEIGIEDAPAAPGTRVWFTLPAAPG